MNASSDVWAFWKGARWSVDPGVGRPRPLIPPSHAELDQPDRPRRGRPPSSSSAANASAAAPSSTGAHDRPGAGIPRAPGWVRNGTLGAPGELGRLGHSGRGGLCATLVESEWALWEPPELSPHFWAAASLSREQVEAAAARCPPAWILRAVLHHGAPVDADAAEGSTAAIRAGLDGGPGFSVTSRRAAFTHALLRCADRALGSDRTDGRQKRRRTTASGADAEAADAESGGGGGDAEAAPDASAWPPRVQAEGDAFRLAWEAASESPLDAEPDDGASVEPVAHRGCMWLPLLRGHGEVLVCMLEPDDPPAVPFRRTPVTAPRSVMAPQGPMRTTDRLCWWRERGVSSGAALPAPA